MMGQTLAAADSLAPMLDVHFIHGLPIQANCDALRCIEDIFKLLGRRVAIDGFDRKLG